MKTLEKKQNILIVAGEPSGDARGAELVRELKPLLKNCSFWGFGGDMMEKEGVEIARHVRDLSMVGAVEILHKLPRIGLDFAQIASLVRKRKPQMAILIDYPGFNLKLARMLSWMSVPSVYYIIPQVWAWGRGRVKKIKRFVKRALVLFPFEETLLKKNGVDCVFVGHPLADSFPGETEPRLDNKAKKAFNIALLPGSRKHEISNMFPVMLEACRIIRQEMPEAVFSLAESPNIDETMYENALSDYPELALERFRGDTAGVLARCDFAVITSGTATLEGAMMEKPMVIVYKASAVTYLFYLLLSRIPFLGLVNIIAQKEVAPELLQNNLTPLSLAKTALEICKDPGRMEKMKIELRKVRMSLGEKGAARKAALSISELCHSLDSHTS
jgi:lipid-A-disaccharide synthase